MELSLSHASLKRDTFHLSDISISIGAGLTAITGKSGSGKTTLLSLLAGLIRPDEGKLSLDGKEVEGLLPSCGIIFQHPERQLFASTVIEDVSFALRRSGLDRDEIVSRCEKVLSLMDIGKEKWNESPFFLSGGERRRVAAAGVLVTEPSFLFMDEPTVGLDSASYERLYGILDSYRKESRCVVIVTHDQEIAGFADRVIVLDDGRISADCLPSDILSSDIVRLSETLGIERTSDYNKLISGIAAFCRGRKWN